MCQGYKFYHTMIPWRDHSFLKDEDDIRLAEDLRRLAEEPVTGRVMVIIMIMVIMSDDNHDIS